MDEYEKTIETDKRIVRSGTGYVIRITKEMALMGLNAGDTVHVSISVAEKKEGEPST